MVPGTLWSFVGTPRRSGAVGGRIGRRRELPELAWPARSMTALRVSERKKILSNLEYSYGSTLFRMIYSKLRISLHAHKFWDI